MAPLGGAQDAHPEPKASPSAYSLGVIASLGFRSAAFRRDFLAGGIAPLERLIVGERTYRRLQRQPPA
jgi:hypothetical protein